MSTWESACRWIETTMLVGLVTAFGAAFAALLGWLALGMIQTMLVEWRMALMLAGVFAAFVAALFVIGAIARAAHWLWNSLPRNKLPSSAPAAPDNEA